MEKENYFLRTILFCLILTAIKLLCLKFIHIPLWVDEAQYWTWSKNLDLGYYSKPPFIAWLIYASTQIFGDTEFGIRLFSPILHFITAIFIYLSAKQLFNQKVGFYSAITYITLPAVIISSSFISSDAPLIFFWALSFYFLIAVTRIYNNKILLLWLSYAACVGLGLLSKYTMAAFVILSFAYIFSIRKDRNFFKLDFWIANFFAFLIFLPNLLWNHDNHFISFIHTKENVVTGGIGGGIKISKMLEFLASQILIFGPALIFFVIAIIKDKEEKDKKNLLLLFSLPLIILGTVIGLISGAQAHWAAPAYITATIFTINFIIKNNKIKWLKTILTINIIIFFLCLNLKIPASIASIKKDPLERVFIWHTIANPVKLALQFNPKAFVVSNERKVIAPLMFDLRDKDGNPAEIYKWNSTDVINDYYDMTRKFNDNNPNSTLIFVSRSDMNEGLSKIFFDVKTIASPDENFSFYLYVLNGRRSEISH